MSTKFIGAKTVSSTISAFFGVFAVATGCSSDEHPSTNPEAGGSAGKGSGGIVGTGGGHAGTGGGQSGAGGHAGTGGSGGTGGVGGCAPPNVIGYRTAGCGMDAMGVCVSGVAGACAGPVVCGCDGKDHVSRCDGTVVGSPYRHKGSCVVPDGGPDAQPDATDGATDARVNDAQPEAGDATRD